MSSRYLDMMRSQRRRAPVQFTSKTLLAILAVIAMAGSAAYWWGVQSQLTGNIVVAVAFTAILVLAPPSLVSFLIPWSPAGMLLQKVNARTYAFPVIIGCALYLLYYSFQIQWSWWAAQPVVANSGLIYQQVLIGMIGFIIIPALLWTPVSSDELVEQVRQAHLVKRYELQTQADIAILRATLLRAQEKALVGFANLTVEEREELAAVMNSLVTGIDKTLREVGQTVKTVSGVALPFDSMLEDNEDIRDVLNYIGDTLVNSTLSGQREDTGTELVPAQAAAATAKRVEPDRRSEREALRDPRIQEAYRRSRARRARRDDDDYDDR
ncbi:MAG TPA: hypothetical protein PKA05_03025 [Roseiflexaceae bacterium]|nr:hypothetical protein [Roseiflexaceae bacterium]HMP39330.1 hypothetical protein [Roseiflexaceae bacterium]